MEEHRGLEGTSPKSKPLTCSTVKQSQSIFYSFGGSLKYARHTHDDSWEYPFSSSVIFVGRFVCISYQYTKGLLHKTVVSSWFPFKPSPERVPSNTTTHTADLSIQGFAGWFLVNVRVLGHYPHGSVIRGFSLGATAGSLAGNMWCTRVAAVFAADCFSGSCEAKVCSTPDYTRYMFPSKAMRLH